MGSAKMTDMSKQRALVEVYSRPGCHLCDEVVEAIRVSGVSHQLDLVIRNIDEDTALADRYGEEIPVVWIDGIKAFKFRCTPAEFRERFTRRAGVR